jgi:hypothetical protein
MGVSQRQPPPHQPGSASTKRSQSARNASAMVTDCAFAEGYGGTSGDCGGFFAQVATGSDFEQIRALNELTRLRATGTE